MINRASLTIALLFPLGCAGEEKSTDPHPELEFGDWEDTGLQGDTGDRLPEPEVFSPATGVWTVQEYTILNDGCGLDDLSARGETGSTMTVDVPRELEVLFDFHGGDQDPARCTVDENSLEYGCAPVQYVDYRAADYGLNADIPVTINTSGSFLSETELDQTNRVSLSCQGSDRGLVAIFLGTSFPCTMETFNGSRAGEGIDPVNAGE